MQQATEPATSRAHCYRCHRPEALCLCPFVPCIAHRTGVLILQHPKERLHPLGTARFATLGLSNARLEVAWGDGKSVAHRMAVPPRTALLYPDPSVPTVEQLAPDERPENLLVIDGTWAQSRALIRQNPWLEALPKLRIEPPRESRYRVRREPRRDYVSTLEAIQYALEALEPEVSLDPLIDAFERLMDDHLAQRGSGDQAPRCRRPRQRRPRAVPHALVDAPETSVVVYLEPSLSEASTGPRLPIQLCAYRVADGARFEQFALADGQPPSDRHLAHMGLSREDFAAAGSVQDAVRALLAFAEGHVTAGWNETPASLVEAAGASLEGHVSLKASYCNVQKAHAGSLESVLRSRQLTAEPLGFRGRAGQRMANAAALLQWLRANAPRPPASPS